MTDQKLTHNPGMRIATREGEALVLAALGKTTKESARIMGISHTTVKAHLDRVRDKLKAKNVAHAVSIAWQKGLLSARNLSVAALIATCATTSISDNTDLRAQGRVSRVTRNGRRTRREFEFLPPELKPTERAA